MELIVLNNVIAERYANGLFLALNSHEKSVKVKSELTLIDKTVKGNRELSAIYYDPTIDVETKTDIVRSIFVGMLPETLNLVATMLKNGKQTILDEVIEAFDFIIYKEDNKKLGKLTVAAPLSEANKELIEKKVSKELNANVVLKETVDQDVLGGFKVEVGSFLIDATIKKQLDNLKKLSI